MLALVAKHLKDVSVLRRLLFAATYFPREMPNVWGVAVEFATCGKVDRNSVDADTAAALIDNVYSFDEKAFDTDEVLRKELLTWSPNSASTKRGKPLGVVLISPETQCVLCAQPLSLRRDRPTSVVLYGNLSGPVPGTHYHKICSNKVCTLTQYYGYYTSGGETSQVFFNANWNYLPWFMSSSLTCFSMDFLRRVDSEVLIGQLSYKQIADIFNHLYFETSK